MQHHHVVKKMLQARQGFTLVELAIAIVIIGLLVGGIIVGKSMSRKAALRTVMVDFQQYKAAVGHFYEQYNFMPGDMPTAVKYWGAQAGGTADGTDATCLALTTAATSALTCNGDGDGRILNNYPEAWRAWQHMANAGMVDGRFSGIAGTAGASAALIGTNVPKSRLKGAGWELFYLGDYGDAFWFSLKWGNLLSFGGNGTNEDDYINNPMITAPEAFNIDTKLDDGKPNTGILATWKTAGNPNCVVATNDAYTLTAIDNACTLFFITGY